MHDTSLKLGINIDHVATLRQARGTDYPEPVQAAALCETAGAHGITVHLREDRRHIQDRDVFNLRRTVSTRLNLEMANSPEIVEIAVEVKPDEVCLVPEKREELTTEGGLDAAGMKLELAPVVERLSRSSIVVSLFIDPDPPQIEAAAALGAPCIELHTGTYCQAADRGDDDESTQRELDRLIAGARLAHRLGLQVNAGHGLNLHNIEHALDIPHLDTLNIGHSIVARAVFVGLEAAVREMLEKMAAYGATSRK